MKKLNITKEAFEKSRYFNDKYGKLEYVSESGKLFKTNKGKILMFREWTSPRKTVQKIKSGELYQKRMPSLEKAIKKFLDSDGVKGQAGTWVLLSDENGDIKLYEHYGYLVGTIIDGHMIWRDNKEYYVSETYSDMILKSLYDGGLIDKYALKESTKKFAKEGTESNPRFKCMEGEDEYSDDIREFRDDVISALKKCYDDEYMVEPNMDGKSILVTSPYSGMDFKLDISVSDEVDM